MPLAVGTLTVREPQRTRPGLSGLVRPRVFRAGLTDFQDYTDQLARGRILGGDRFGLAIPLAIPYGRAETTARPDIAQSVDYVAACKALDRSPAGRRATELLMDHLDPAQRRTAERYRYFDLGLCHPELIEECLRLGDPVKLNTVYFRILRGFPNGNVYLGYRPGEHHVTLCLHPLRPYPTDDICLAQKVMIERAPDEFIRAANATRPRPGLQRPTHYDQMFAPPPEPTRLVIPHQW